MGRTTRDTITFTPSPTDTDDVPGLSKSIRAAFATEAGTAVRAQPPQRVEVGRPQKEDRSLELGCS